tara:strand:- start:2863 stop:3219 length:357 start_codon:yes stop_codon:yes gene_type:complete
MSVNAQLTIEKYKSDDTEISIETVPQAMRWEVDDQGTETTVDDVLYTFMYSSDGSVMGIAKGLILSATFQEKTFSFEIQNPDKSWYIVVFWYETDGEEPLVAYEYANGYTLYSGAIEY